MRIRLRLMGRWDSHNVNVTRLRTTRTYACGAGPPVHLEIDLKVPCRVVVRSGSLRSIDDRAPDKRHRHMDMHRPQSASSNTPLALL